MTSRASKWAEGSLTQILQLQDELSGTRLDTCQAHRPLAAPFPCPEPAGEPGAFKCGRDFLSKAAWPKS